MYLYLKKENIFEFDSFMSPTISILSKEKSKYFLATLLISLRVILLICIPYVSS